MGKVNSFSLEGIYSWFNSQEHRPPHFHAKRKGQWYVRVYFLKKRPEMIQRVRGPRGRMSTSDANVLQDMAELYRAELLKEWEGKVRYGN